MNSHKISIKRSAFVIFFFLFTTSALSAQETTRNAFSIPEGVQISVPNTWEVANEKHLREYEKIRDDLLKKGDLNPPAIEAMARARVPFQATAGREPGSLTVMISILPAEISQEEILKWPENVIQKLGALLFDAQKKAITAAGAHDIAAGSVSIVDAGRKKAIYFTISFEGPDRLKYLAEKYMIYTNTRTIIYTTQVSLEQFQNTAQERLNILESLRVD